MPSAPRQYGRCSPPSSGERPPITTNPSQRRLGCGRQPKNIVEVAMKMSAHALNRPIHTGWLHAAASAISRTWNTYLQRRTRRATVLMMQALDDYTLRDIGINRSEIESVVYGRPVERKR